MILTPSQPFTREQAVAAGITDAQLRGRTAYRRLFRGVYVGARVELTLAIWLQAALLASPPGSVVSHVTALRWYGYELGALWPLHVSSRTTTHSRQKQLTAHRRRDVIRTRILRGVPVTEPDRTLVDVAYDVTVPELIQAIEWMLLRGYTTLSLLTTCALDHHLRGVRRVRQVIGFVREGSESPMETRVRLMIRFAHLPEPAPNVVLRDDQGHFLARGDLVYARWKVLVEYDGWHHERDAGQRQRDIGRRERLEAAGWRVIVVTVADLKAPRLIVHRVHGVLVARGYAGPGPVFSVVWDIWFPTTAK
ncbi:DUF559 domain-containing protein [Aeromicrobium sp. 9AM]|uniref:DUF559 domain-containing protein n=1 Tax=Aeromicrobium sp. 9AM TaxID=2653126 RepID=UPI0012EF1815|nr:DUF559 domain-containing protein [Aeromicrobium sp. 9AM]VXC55097.1 conserved hypothetical protein [Aeromicrobium sp. 9AM]